MLLALHRQATRSHRPSMAMPLAAALYRASGLVLWHLADLIVAAINVRCCGNSRPQPSIRSDVRMTANGGYCCKSRKSIDAENLATSPCAERISGPEKCRSSSRKDFCNTIGAKRTFAKPRTSAKCTHQNVWFGRYAASDPCVGFPSMYTSVFASRWTSAASDATLRA
jgi:hypothetical protein